MLIVILTHRSFTPYFFSRSRNLYHHHISLSELPLFTHAKMVASKDSQSLAQSSQWFS